MNIIRKKIYETLNEMEEKRRNKRIRSWESCEGG